jgi:hypothetical protein
MTSAGSTSRGTTSELQVISHDDDVLELINLAFCARCSIPSPLKWLLNGSSRATPGLGVPLNDPDRDHDERTQDPRFSRAPQRGHRRPPVGPDIMATLRGPGTAAPKRRPGAVGGIDEALINGHQ